MTAGLLLENRPFWDFSVVHWLRLHAPSAGGLGSIPSQGARSHRPQLRPGAAKQINIKKKKKIGLG